jgi:hypothetical protein
LKKNEDNDDDENVDIESTGRLYTPGRWNETKSVFNGSDMIITIRMRKLLVGKNVNVSNKEMECNCYTH